MHRRLLHTQDASLSWGFASLSWGFPQTLRGQSPGAAPSEPLR
jgi:hypothetical protein